MVREERNSARAPFDVRDFEVSVEAFERWKEETIEVRGDGALMKKIRAGLRALKSRKARLYTLEELLG